ncbi:MAG: TonB-dependent receptor [Pseudomonadota bacterium]
MIRTILLSTAVMTVAVGAEAQFAYENAQKEVAEDLTDCLEERGLAPGESSPFCIVRKNRVLNTITTYGDRSPIAAGAVSIVDAETIASIAADHPAEVLNTLPGVNIHTNSGQEHLIAIRSPVLTGGAGQGSFLILENGVPTRSPAFGNVNSLLEPHHEVADAIEVVRGPGSAKYGSNAVHGLINVILSEPSGASLKQVNASYGSLGRYKGDLIYDQGYLGRAALSIQKDTGWRDNTGLFQLKGSGVTQAVFRGWDVTAWGGASYLEQETADFIQGADAYEDRDIAKANDDPLAYRDAWSARGAIRLERDFAGGRLSLTPFGRTQQMDFRQHFLPYRGFEKNGHTGIGLMSRFETTASETLTWRIGGDVDLASGYLRETQAEPFGFFPSDSRFPVGIHYDYTVATIVGALWGEADLALTDKLTVLLGLRGEAHSYDYSTDAPVGVNGRFNVPADRTDDFAFATPKLGLTYEASDDLTLYTNYARGSRAPQASDLYRLQSQQGVAEAEVETLDSFEVGARGVLADGSLVFDLAAYTADKDNFFFRDSDGLNVTDGSTRHQGVELAAAWQFSPIFELSGNLSWSDQVYSFDRIVGNGSEVIRDGNQIDSAPEWLANLAVAWLPNDQIRFEISTNYVGEYFTNPANTADYPGHWVANLRASYDVNEGLETFIIVRNLADETYADRADFAFGDERYFPGEPLNVTLGLRKKID